jgi:predicted cobalt transporter CbtA
MGQRGLDSSTGPDRSRRPDRSKGCDMSRKPDMSTAWLAFRGLVCGILGGVVAAGLLLATVEPYISRAIAFEKATEESIVASEVEASGSPTFSGANAGGPQEDELFTRRQQIVGGLTGTVLGGAAWGLLFGLGLALVRKVFWKADSVGTSFGNAPRRPEWLWTLVGSVACFVVLSLVPLLVYPPNPPGVGDPETIGRRTAAYLAMVVGSLCAAIIAWSVYKVAASKLARALLPSILGSGTYIAGVLLLAKVLPDADPVDPAFPPDVLWGFRAGSLAMLAVMWLTIGTAMAFVMRQAARGGTLGDERPLVDYEDQGSG